MSNQGDDCYFYFYSTCTKGDSCPFRHCEAALGNETVCSLWEEGRCFRQVCKFRHMKIDKKRSEIPCYWENQLSGCQKANCAFHHTRGRYVDGVFLPPSKSVILRSEPVEEEVKATQNKLAVPVSSSPQLRGVIKVESSENVPSPTHPPVVINAADDDEDDDDQYSEEGDESKLTVQQLSSDTHNGLRIISTRKTTTPKKGEGLNFGIKTLEEIKSKKLKERGSRQSAYSVPVQSHPGTEKENLRTVIRTVTLCTKTGDEPYIGLSLAERLGQRRAPSVENPSGGRFGPVLKRSLAERLGRKMESPEKQGSRFPKPVHVSKSVKERLELPAEQCSDEMDKTTKLAEKIHIKTLEEIRLEKAGQKREQEGQPMNEAAVQAEESNVATKPPSVRIKTFSEVLAEKKQRQLEEEQRNARSEKSSKSVAKVMVRKAGACKVQPENAAGKAEAMKGVWVKTLEEIKRDKALRLQQSQESSSNDASQEDPASTGWKRLLRVSKPAFVNEEKQPVAEDTCIFQPSIGDNSTEHLDVSMTSSNPDVQVKSFEEIMREKRQRKQLEGDWLQKESVIVSPPLLPAPEKEAAEENMIVTVKKQSAETTAEKPDEAVPTRSLPAAKARDCTLAAATAVQPSERKGKGKPKGNVKPSSSAKGPSKRKAPKSQPSAVATVKPLSSDLGAVQLECPAKKVALAAVEERSITALVEERPLAVPVSEMSKESSESTMSSLAASTPRTEMDNPTLMQSSIKTRRLSSASGSKTPLSVEDDFEKLMWEISGGKLEAEIDLDPGKDEDDLLLELSEMIDS
uniref:Zinc finger CCCH domain-containing protein 11A n=1 Tax=Geotrypetes seraphini TaxID=260995 RepID=A0A6P8PEQ0_GEOSA|nr:zinc finger CCCH domain-containing protein 11A [Geotrypetes seraphini]XP_033774076.1 zinc finger CCCH domain-containing protein 11A [Geotrypetes seraphini]